MVPKGFIEVTCLSDGYKALIRTDLIVAFYEYGPERNGKGTIKPAHVEILYDSDKGIDVVETFEEVSTMIWNAEL